MTFTFDVETWFKDSVHLFPTSTIVYNIRKILIYYSKQRCDMTFIFYLKRVFKITAYTLPKGNMCANYQVCAILERIYGLGKDFTISIDLSISQTQNCGSRSMHILRSISRVWTMGEKICSGQIISSGRSDGLTVRLVTTKLLDSEMKIYSSCFKSYRCCI